MNELHESVDKNKLYFKYVGLTKDANFYEYMDSKEFFNELRDNHTRFDEVIKKQQEMLKKINEVRISGKNAEQEKVVKNIENFYRSKEEVFNFFRDCSKMVPDSGYEAKQGETKETGLKILTLRQILQRLLTALVQVKARNNSET